VATLSAYYDVFFQSASGKDSHKEYYVFSEQEARFAAIKDGAKYIHSIKLVKETAWNTQYFSRDYKYSLLTALKFQVEGGVPIGYALKAVVDGEPNPLKRARLEKSVEVLQRGGGLAGAMAQTGLFDDTTVAILRGGEVSGAAVAITTALAYMEGRKTYWKKFVGVMAVLSMEISSAVSMPYALDEYAIPFIKNYFMHAQKNQEAADLILSKLAFWEGVNLAFMYLSYGLVLFATIYTIVYFFNKEVKARTDEMMAEMPLVGNLISNSVTASLFQIGASMLRSGISVPTMVDHLIKVTKNHDILNKLRSFSGAMTKGMSVSHAAENSGLFTPVERLVISSHQDTKDLANIFDVISKSREEKAASQSKFMMQLSVYIVILYLAISVLIGVGVFSVFTGGADTIMNMMTNSTL